MIAQGTQNISSNKGVPSVKGTAILCPLDWNEATYMIISITNRAFNVKTRTSTTRAAIVEGSGLILTAWCSLTHATLKSKCTGVFCISSPIRMSLQWTGFDPATSRFTSEHPSH